MSVCCPCCGWQGNEFLPGGGIPRPNALCPSCGLLERHRLLWLYLRKKTNFFSAKLNVLHIGPEPFLEKAFKKLPNLDYLSCDLNASLAMQKIDITNIPFADNIFDAVICYHVLEHILEDKKAIGEMFRILKPLAWAIIQSPVDQTREKTFEDPAITTPEQRLKYFYQKDHVRIYGRDFKRRLEQPGFTVKVEDFTNSLDHRTITLYGLKKNEKIYHCSKPVKVLTINPN
jgi:SAM-dependent methyltransferase